MAEDPAKMEITEIKSDLREVQQALRASISLISKNQTSTALQIEGLKEKHRTEISAALEEITELKSSPSYTSAHLDGKAFSASNQIEYFSNQIFKWDLEALAFTPTGFSFLGAEIVKFPWVEKIRSSDLVSSLQERLPSWLHQADPSELRTGNDGGSATDTGRLDGIDRRLGRHDTTIRGILQNQRRFANTVAGDTQQRGNVSDSRARSLSGQRGQRRAADGYRAESTRLNSAASDLRGVTAEAERLQRALG
ncbi:hypothetical protein ACIQ7D_23300 [Streptomyces sp. NPDC096310]|uniref:hypothetical protein n=1 Tax=Streptomyces sp. NPDC096310 TaxID=3366082 RepID=UPI00380F8329